VKVVAIVRDSAGNATASTKTVKLPKEDALDI
jgi:hypothetical protein